MNRSRYRLVFNAARGLLMAVAENAPGRGKTASGQTARASGQGSPAATEGGVRSWRLHGAVLAGLAAAAWLPGAGLAQIVADPGAPGAQRPTVLQAANGVPQVNIQTPSAAGVSRNTYSQFDVSNRGAILNNSRVDVQTQLGGWVQTNPWLAGGSARVILNEVNSSQPSHLHGYLEVAGQRAEVVVANPSGIDVNGGGFINASAVTLSTGVPVWNGGELDGHRVRDGRIAIQGAGLDTRSTDYTTLLARAVEVNAGLWAQALEVVTGSNDIRTDLDGITVQAVANGGPAPGFALDVAQLGGMYAGKIHLVGTEAGVGVNLQGVVGAGAGDLVLQHNGWLSVDGELAAAQTLSVTAQHITHRGLLDARDTNIDALELHNIGTGRIYGDRISVMTEVLRNDSETLEGQRSDAVVAARERLDIGVRHMTNRDGATLLSLGDLAIGGGLDADRQATGRAQVIENQSATIEAMGALTVSAVTLRNTNEHLTTHQVHLPQEGPYVEYKLGAGDVYQGQDLVTRYPADEVRIWQDESKVMTVIATGDSSDTFTRYTYTRQVEETQVLTSEPGQLLAGGDMHLDIGTLVNADSRILAGGVLAVQADTLSNEETPATRSISETGDATSFWRIRQKGADTWGSASSPYQAQTIESISMGTTRVAGQAGVAGAQRGGFVSLTSSLQAMASSPEAGHLVETDPRFTQRRQWLSSDHLLSALSHDPTTVHKRLGDGFLEQRLVREQVADLTGRRFLGDFQQDEAQYKALMNAGVTFAQAHQLVPGIALTADQIAQLSADIVWLVEREVTLPDGTRTIALVPQVYVRPREGDLTPSGSLLAANEVQLELGGDLVNAGTIAGRQITAINAENLHQLGGRISGQHTALSARQDVNIVGGTVEADRSLEVVAGADLNLVSTTRSQTTQAGANTFRRTALDRVAGLYLNDAAGVLLASAGGHVSLVGAVVDSAGEVNIQAANDIRLQTVTTESRDSIHWDARNFLHQGQTAEIGARIQAGTVATVLAGNDLHARAASVQAGVSGSGALLVQAGGSIQAAAGVATQSLDEAHQVKSSGFLSSRTLTTRDQQSVSHAVGSHFGGETVSLQAGDDIRVQGAHIVSDQGTDLVAGRDVVIEAAQTSNSQQSFRDTRKSGLFSGGGGLGVTLGTQQQSLGQRSDQTMAVASIVGALGGDVNISAGQAYTQTGTDVLAPGGDINIRAQDVQIVEARETSQSSVEQQFRQSGLTVALTGPVISVLQTVQQMGQAASQTSDTRMQALAAASAALAGYGAYTAIDNGQGRTIGGKDNQIYTGQTNPDGTPQTRDATAADRVGGINLSIGLGSSRSISTQIRSADSARGSSHIAGGDIHIQASGAGVDSDLLVRGSELNAAGNVSLQADGDVTLQAAASTAAERSSNSSRSSSIGVSIGTSGFGITASANRGKGQSDGAETTYNNTHVSGTRVDIQSGQDATLQGAVVHGEQVGVNAGGDLNIQSLQDSATYNGRSSSMGGSLTVGAGFSASLSAGKTRVDSDYQSVTEQSGIRAGDGGFQVVVGGDATLTGGAITSTQVAVVQDRNRFESGGELTLSDLRNRAAYDARSVGVTVGVGTSLDDGKLVPSGTGAGVGKDGGQTQSMTLAAISDIAGNTQARTGNAETGIARIFDQERVNQEINAQVQITQAFGQQASKAVDDYVQAQKQILREAYKHAPDAERVAIQAQYDDLIMQERVMNVLIGAVTGLAGSALAKETLALAGDEMQRISVENSMRSAGMVDAYGNVITNLRPGEEDKLWQDIDLAGTRLDPDGICGPAYERCVKQVDADGKLLLDANGKPQLAYNAEGRMQFDHEVDGKQVSVYDFLDNTDEGKKMHGITGGIQGGAATFMGYAYPPGGVVDRVFKAFAGEHDYIGGQASGLYDDQGNIKQGTTEVERTSYNTWSAVAIVPSAPFAMAELLPPEMWKAISILLGAVK